MAETIVEWFGLRDGSRCGYCKSETTKVNHGMWAHRMSCDVYQQLLDRGWRRSGMYCYKPVMQSTCCPQYTIRCDATQVKLTKSQKKVIKRLNNFLVSGLRSGGVSSSYAESQEEGVPEEPAEVFPRMACDVAVDSILVKADTDKTKDNDGGHIGSKVETVEIAARSKAVERAVSSDIIGCNKHSPTHENPVVGADPSKPKCRKKKDIRRENKLLKLNNNSEMTQGLKVEKGVKNFEKSIDDYFEDQTLPEKAHDLTLNLLNVKDKSSFEPTFNEEFELYRKYQTIVHGDVEADITERRFRRFLIDGPLKYIPPLRSSDCIPAVGLGAFHQQYRLDGKLIAVGVIDILPECVSSKYFFYDPDYRFLSIGTYSALQEIYLVRSLNRSCPALKYYYMGFYIESCPKMNYKGKYTPSFLLCPETYSWKQIEMCIPKFNENKYARLEDDDVDCPALANVSTVLILHENEAITFSNYMKRLDPNTASDQRKEIKEYSELVGHSCRNILLYRSW